ncbi:PhdYeFM domain-containing protein [Streptomyces sp. HNM0574]|uniref:PhdYeFM domain-containing protein n=1 Tax=Streptomyces sp. HNM0574 TaxID=2714954 RepID=UPI00146EFD7A|nr:PhdYeFM domain-containing protein [Streptomyces sp. HNM0574]NLU66730.1 PhdYeFM domain-containing protein [Streptomyces sp. HNM0574]
MRRITGPELRSHHEAVLAALASGTASRATDAARPGGPRRFVPVEELQRRWRDLPHVDAARMRAEADAFFGDEDRLTPPR